MKTKLVDITHVDPILTKDDSNKERLVILCSFDFKHYANTTYDQNTLRFMQST